MARPISQEKLDEITADLRKRWGTVGIRAFAADHAVSDATIRRAAAKAGLDAGERRASAENAAATTRATFAQQRAAIAQRMLDMANEALDEVGRGSVVTGISWGEVVCKQVDKLTASDRRQLLTSAAIALDKHAMLDRYDSEADVTDVAKFLQALGGALDSRRETSLGSES